MGDVKLAARQAGVALAGLGASVLAMCADSWWVGNPAGTDVAAVIFIPLALSFLWSLATLANFAACAYAAARAALRRPVPDHGRIAELEAGIPWDGE
jgi:hypothetical protein